MSSTIGSTADGAVSSRPPWWMFVLASALILNRAPRTYWLTTAGATLLSARSVQLATLVLALIVAFRRPVDRSARVGAWVLGTLAVYSIVWPYQIAATWRALPAVLGLALW